MIAAARQPFPLVPRWRVTGLPFGEQRSVRRGPGSDVAGSRRYEPGDPVGAIDWFASARLSSASGREEFVVREHYEDEAPRVVLVSDRRPSMSLYDEPFPWLSKPAASAAVAEAIVLSTLAARGEIAYLDESGNGSRNGEPFWLPPRAGRGRWEVTDRIAAARPFDAPEDTLERSLQYLLRARGDLPGGTFLFVLSDFLEPPEPATWLRVLALRWDVVPVVIQDPVWEQSFPEVPSVVLPFVEPGTDRLVEARLTAREARGRRVAHEERLRDILGGLRRLGLDPIMVGTSDPLEIDAAFLSWAELRRKSRRLRR